MPANVESMFYVKDDGVPWHGLGESVREAQTAEEAIVAAGLNWEVETVPSRWQDPTTGEELVDESRFKVLRSDKYGQEALLGDVGRVYRPIQNREAFAFADNLVGEGHALYHTAGALCGGQKVWLLANLAGHLQMPADDEVGKFLLLANAHDGGMSLTASVTPIRVVCQNTLRLALKGAQNTFRIRHTPAYEDRLDEARKALGIADAYYRTFSDLAFHLAGKQMKSGEAASFLEELIPDPEDEETSNTRAKNARQGIQSLFDGAGTGLDRKGIRGTRYCMLNAVAEYDDHVRTVRMTRSVSSEDEARMRSSWFGNNQLKNRAANLLAA